MQFHSKRDVFFDLDHTLWDFDKNAEETLAELFVTYRFADLGILSSDLFIETYNRHNKRLWSLYHLGKIDKEQLREQRFSSTFMELGVESSLFPKSFELDYLRICPQKTNLFPHTHEILAYLQSKYRLHLISNGFKEASQVKIANSKLQPYFSTIVLSEDVGVHKPDPKIFHYAVRGAETTIASSVMIGDSLEADIQGALNVGMSAIYFNPLDAPVPQNVTHAVVSLHELTTLL